MKNILLFSFGLFFGHFLFGCTTLNIYQPTNINEIPETSNGNPATSFDFGTLPGYNYTSTSDASFRPPTWDPLVQRASAASGRLRFPIKSLPMEFAIGGYVSGIFGVFKYQFLGPRFFEARKGDVSLAFVAKGSAGSGTKQSGDQNGLFGAGGNPWNGQMASNGMAGSLLVGYRAADPLLLYTGGLYSDSSVKATITQDISASGSNPGGTYTYTDRIRRCGPVAGLLVSVGRLLALHFEASYLRTTFDQANVLLPDETTLSAALRFDVGRSEKGETP